MFGHLVDEPAQRVHGRRHPAQNQRPSAPTTRTSPQPGSTAWLAQAVHELDTAMHDPSRAWADDATTLALLQQADRLIAGLHALQAQALVRLAGPSVRTEQHRTGDDGRGTVTISDPVRAEIATALRWTESHADERITVARLLHRVLPLTREALSCGAITYRHASSIADVVGRHSHAIPVLEGTADADAREGFAADAAFIEQRAVGLARRSGVSAARQAADRALRRRDADHVRIRRQRALRQRDVWLEVEPDGTALLLARMGVTQAHACLSAIDALARDPRLPLTTSTPTDAGIGERRSEALAFRLLAPWSPIGNPAPNAEGGPSSPAARTTTAHIDVTVDLGTLLGLADGPVAVQGRGPGATSWTDVDEVRALLADAGAVTLRRLVTAPLTGHLLDRGRRTYRVTDALRDFLVARDRTCRFPGCHRSARLTQMDHAVPWGIGGTTDRANLGALCTRHHQLKTHGGWRITASDESGSCTWRSPLGLEYRHAPPAMAEPHEATALPTAPAAGLAAESERSCADTSPLGGRDGPIPF